MARLQVFKAHGIHVLGLLHLRPAERSTGDVPRHGGPGLPRRGHLRAVRDADALPRHGGLRALGTRPGPGGRGRRRRADHAPLADPAGPAAEGLHAAPGDVSRRDPLADAGRLGPVLLACRASGRGRRSCRRGRADWRSSWSRSSIARCTRTRASPPTRRARPDRRGWARLIARPCRRLFAGTPMPELMVPGQAPADLAPTAW